MPLLTKGLTTFGKSILIAAGAGIGLLRGLRSLNAAADRADLSVLTARIDSLSLAVARLSDQSDRLSARQADFVTPTELAATLDRVFGKLTGEVDDRFERQTRSVEALHLMVGQTDELLQKVLDGLDAIGSGRELAQTRH